MKKLVSIILAINFYINYFAQTCPKQQISSILIPIPDCNTGNFKLVFEDNFNGSTLDTTKWELETNRQGALQGELNQELNTLNNIEVSGGTLKIKAKKETIVALAVSWKGVNDILEDGLPNLRTYNFTSSNIWTINKYKAIGKYEVHCKMPNGKGFWPAFWTFAGFSGAGGQKWNELDVIDNLKGNSKYSNGVIYDWNNDGIKEECRWSTTNIPNFSQWHTYTCTYENDKITWEIDHVPVRVLYRYTTISSIPLNCGDNAAIGTYLMEKSFPQEDMQIILNLAIRSAGSDEPDNNTIFPSTYEIDYVRYWEREPIPKPCNNDVIKSLPFDGYDAGDNAFIFDQAKVEFGHGAEIVARDGINIFPNFEVELGAGFIARIDPVICGTARIADTTNNENANYMDGVSNIKKQLITNNDNFKIYPNPTKGNFTIELQNAVAGSTLEIYDVMGQLVFSEKILEAKKQLSLTGYPKGIYLIKVINGNEVFTEKIIYQ